MDSNAILQMVLKFCEGCKPDDTPLSPYHILYGYAKLLSMDVSTLSIMFSDKDTKDLDEARRFFKEKKCDAPLVRQGLPLLFSNLEDADQLGDCSSLIEDMAKSDSKISSYDLLQKLLPEGTPIFEVFAEGHKIEDVLDYQKTLKAIAPADPAAETAENAAPAETQAANAQETAEDSKPEGAPAEAPPLTFPEVAEKYRKLRVDLLDAVKGQNDPVMEFVRDCFQGNVLGRDEEQDQPRASFLFVGPPGTGKSLMARTAARSLGLPCMLLGISMYMMGPAESVTYFVKEHPECVLIFDDVDRADSDVYQLLIQVLEQGYTVIRSGIKISFRKAIIIMTTSAGRDLYENNYGDISGTPKSVILEALRSEMIPGTNHPRFPSVFCDCLSAADTIMFSHLSMQILARMVEENFSHTAEQIRSEYGYQVSYDHRLPLLFLFHQGNSEDAKPVIRQSGAFMKNELYELSRQIESHEDLLNNIEALHFEIDLSSEDLDPELRGLFEKPRTTEIAVLCREEDRSLFSLPEDYVVRFAETPEELEACLNNDVSFVLIDPMFGLKEGDARGVSLDDYGSIGVKSFFRLKKSGDTIPVYLLETGSPLGETDKNTFTRLGAAGVVSTVSSSPETVNRQLQQIAEEICMEARGQEFLRRGYVLDFNTAQIPDGATLRVQYHSLHKQRVIDSASAASFVADVDRPKVTFDDVIGAENAKNELRYFIKFLSNPRKFISEGGKPAKGVLLYGPPGTGKTMLARAMAGESDVAFIQTSATEFLNKYFGQSEENVRNVFRTAQKYAPSIIFIDEIDAIGKSRTGEFQHTESVLNALLTELDGFRTDVNKPVFVLAATNYKLQEDGSGQRTLDPALVRRFDNRILVDLPNEKERIQYLTRVVKEKGFVDVSESTIKNLAARTPGLSIAILQNVADLAFRNASKLDRAPNGEDLLNALEEYSYGEKKDWGEKYYRSVAIHESGHSYMAWKSGEKPSYVTIVSRGSFGGYMAHENSEDKPVYSKEELTWRIRCALAGRAAEEVFYGRDASLNTGASGDLQTATQYALSMLCDYGMTDGNFIALPFRAISGTPMAASYLEQANRILRQEMAKTVELIEEGKEKVKKLADRLLEENNLTGEKIQAVFEETD
ncbi:MAG: AAA family ATPase [Lachnospiraceae bacterium]|nr:AAA family ATPase [Lachnospiraceae bacterium]